MAYDPSEVDAFTLSGLGWPLPPANTELVSKIARSMHAAISAYEADCGKTHFPLSWMQLSDEKRSLWELAARCAYATIAFNAGARPKFLDHQPCPDRKSVT